MKQPEIRHYGIVRNGKKVYYNTDLYLRQIQSLEGKEFEETIKEKHKKPSKSTHGYYRGGIIASLLTTEEFAGWEAEEVNDFFLNMFSKRIIEKYAPSGHKTEIVHIDTTGDMNQKEMATFIDKILVYLTNQGIQILNPEEYNLTKYRIIK